MATADVSEVLNAVDTPVAIPTAKAEKWESSAVVADIVTMGTGTLLASVFNVALVFIVPKLTTVENYGYWRLFLLYASYAGVLHLGMVDGALLKWAGRSLPEIQEEIPRCIRFLVWQNLTVVVVVCLCASVLRSSDARFLVLSVLAVSLIQNLTTLFQVALQASRHFRPVAISTAAPLGLLLCILLLGKRVFETGYHELVFYYAAGWVLTLAWLFSTLKSWRRSSSRLTMRVGLDLILAGWPIVLSNASLAFAQQLDRFAVSWVGNIHDFAMYSLAASAVAVPMLLVQAIYKVVFSHLATITSSDRMRIYSGGSRLLLLAWIPLLLYYFLLQVVIADFLPQYRASLPVAAVLLLGTLFLASVQILQMSFANLHGRQHQFLVRTLEMLVIGLAITIFAALVLRSLMAVAVAEVVTVGTWWLLNEWDLRDLSGQSFRDWARFLGVGCIAGAGYAMAVWWGHSGILPILLYCTCATVTALIFCRTEVRLAIGVADHLPQSSGVGVTLK
jgi:O-antigen/teichoic acid export membrane protein